MSILRKYIILAGLLISPFTLFGSGYLHEIPDYLARIPVIIEGYFQSHEGYLRDVPLKPVRVDPLCRSCNREKLLSLVPAPAPKPEDINLEAPIPVPTEKPPLEVSSGADPFVQPNIVIGGKRISQKDLSRALVDPDDFLSVFEKDISKTGGPQEKIHIPFSVPYNSSNSNGNPYRVPSKATYIRE